MPSYESLDHLDAGIKSLEFDGFLDSLIELEVELSLVSRIVLEFIAFREVIGERVVVSHLEYLGIGF